MRYLHRLILVVALFSCAALAQPAKAPQLKDFAGTWRASFQGKEFLTLQLEFNNGQMTGNSITHYGLNLDKDGNISELEPLESNESKSRVESAKLKGSVLEFETVDPENNERFSFKMILKDPHTAGLKLIVPDAAQVGIPHPKPWELRRD